MSQAYQEHFAKLRRTIPQSELPQRRGANSSANLRRGLDVKNQSSRTKIWIIIAAALFVASALGLLWDENVEQMLPKWRWSWVTKGYATESKIDEEKKTHSTDRSTESRVHVGSDTSSDSFMGSAETSALGPLIELQSRLRQKEAELNALEQELSRKEKALAEQLAELQKIRDEISSKVQKTIQESDKSVDQLVEVYSSMKPAQAAEVLSQLQDELATKILSRMKKKTAAEIMGFLKPEKAKSLTERIAGFNSP